jgi:hypothetical protein
MEDFKPRSIFRLLDDNIDFGVDIDVERTNDNIQLLAIMNKTPVIMVTTEELCTNLRFIFVAVFLDIVVSYCPNNRKE